PARLVEDSVGLRYLAVRPEVRGERVLRTDLPAPRLPRRRGIARDEHDLVVRVPEGLDVLLQVERLLLADGSERERVEDEEDVGAAEEVGEPHAPLVAHLEIELGRLVTRPHRHHASPRRCPRGDSTGVREALPAGTGARIPPGRRAGTCIPRRVHGLWPPCGVPSSGASPADERFRARARLRVLPRSRLRTRSTDRKRG